VVSRGPFHLARIPREGHRQDPHSEDARELEGSQDCQPNADHPGVQPVICLLVHAFWDAPEAATVHRRVPAGKCRQEPWIQRGGETLEVEEQANIQPIFSRLSQIHKSSLGFPSGWHNEFFSEVQRARCLLFKRDNRLEGYAFFRRNGRVGPLVVRSASSFRQALEATLRFAADQQCEELTIVFAGTNEEAALASIRHGFRIKYPLLFLSSKPMGDWDNYLFYSPGLM
jgi:hypothetical protein